MSANRGKCPGKSGKDRCTEALHLAGFRAGAELCRCGVHRVAAPHRPARIATRSVAGAVSRDGKAFREDRVRGGGIHRSYKTYRTYRTYAPGTPSDPEIRPKPTKMKMRRAPRRAAWQPRLAAPQARRNRRDHAIPVRGRGSIVVRAVPTGSRSRACRGTSSLRLAGDARRQGNRLSPAKSDHFAAHGAASLTDMIKIRHFASDGLETSTCSGFSRRATVRR